MLTIDQIVEAIAADKTSDKAILLKFLSEEQIQQCGLELTGRVNFKSREYTAGNLIRQLELSVESAFKEAFQGTETKARKHYVDIKALLWALEDDRHQTAGYGYKGIPLYRSVATYYGFRNP